MLRFQRRMAAPIPAIQPSPADFALGGALKCDVRQNLFLRHCVGSVCRHCDPPCAAFPRLAAEKNLAVLSRPRPCIAPRAAPSNREAVALNTRTTVAAALRRCAFPRNTVEAAKEAAFAAILLIGPRFILKRAKGLEPSTSSLGIPPAKRNSLKNRYF